MQKWDVEPDQVAASMVSHFPREAEQIGMDFLEAALKAGDPSQVRFWTAVVHLVDHMQAALDEPSYAREARIGAV